MTEASKPPPRRPPPPPRETRVAALAPTINAGGGALETDTATPAPAKVDPYLGKTIDGRYVVERMIGEGGMGVVYAGRHKVIDKKVAIKVLRGEMVTDREANERFLQEARAASAIGHPHIVDISDFGQLPDGSTYFVMEYLNGKSLGSLVGESQRPIAVPRLFHIAKQIAQGLAAAHAANIIHRDLKPDNVMLVDHGTAKDFVKILDFGIAKVGSGTKKMTRAGSVFGTPHYMSPEQAAGTPVDHRTDVYALGVILYEMASGQVPFDADNFMGILTQHMYRAPVPIRTLVPPIDVPAGLDAIILKCLTKRPEGRYAGMAELVLDLERLERGEIPVAVEEMMARSGTFGLPSDYFQSARLSIPAPVDGRVAPRRWPLYAVIGAVATIVGVMLVVMVGKNSEGGMARAAASTASPPQLPRPVEAQTAAPPPAPMASAREPPPPSSPSAAMREVLLSVVPQDATLSRDGQDLGGAPVALHLAPGEVATIVIARKGYRTKTIAVDSTAPKQSIALEAYGAPAPKSPAKAASSTPPAKTGALGDDVGDPFAH